MGEDALRLFLPLLLLAGCASAQPGSTALTVGEVWARHHELDGQPIRVEGVVTRCEQLGCPLQESAEAHSKWLGIGSSKTFDRTMSKHLGELVVIEGRLRADCLHIYADPKGQSAVQTANGEVVEMICTDRSSMIMEPKLVGIAK